VLAGSVSDLTSSLRRVSILVGSIKRMTTTSITSIQSGIVFLMATWSGGAQWAFSKLVSYLEQHDVPSEQLHVFDIDQHQELYDLPELAGKVHGWGETLVIKDGRVVLFTRLGKNQHLIQENLDEILRVYAA
jgi:hypothetical protein